MDQLWACKVQQLRGGEHVEQCLNESRRYCLSNKSHGFFEGDKEIMENQTERRNKKSEQQNQKELVCAVLPKLEQCLEIIHLQAKQRIT